MRSSYLLSIIIVCGISLSGCSELTQYMKESNDLYNSHCYKGENRQRVEDITGYYVDNLPDTSENDKADILMKRLKENGYDPQIAEQKVKVTRKVVTIDGKRVWPTTSNKVYDWNDWQASMDHMNDTLKEAKKDFGDKKPEACLSGACERSDDPNVESHE